MKRAIVFSLAFLAISLTVNSQTKKEKDQESIKDMCGCFEVTFNFAETFSYSKDSLYKPSETKVDKGLEWAQLVEDEDNKISIQHLLQVGRPDSPHIVKHWRQDWLFENTDFYTYNGDNEWVFETKSKEKTKWKLKYRRTQPILQSWINECPVMKLCAKKDGKLVLIVLMM